MCGRMVFFSFFFHDIGDNYQNSRGLKLCAEERYVFWQGHSSSVITKHVTRSRGKRTDCFAGRGGMEINKRGSPHCRRIGNNTHTWTGRASSSHVERNVRKSRENLRIFINILLNRNWKYHRFLILLKFTVTALLFLQSLNL